MSLIRSILGRRQFLIAAGVTSTSALAYKNLTGVVDPIFHTYAAMASDGSRTSVKGGTKIYSHLLSPIKIRNVIVKNRMYYTLSNPHYLQGPEIFPSDVYRSYFAYIAKNAAIVSVRTVQDPRPRKDRMADSAHSIAFDLEDAGVQNYVDQMIEGVHSMGSLVVGSSLGGGKDVVTQAKQLEDKGYDVIGMGGVRDLQDKNAVRAAIEQMEAVKKATNLIILMQVSASDPLITPETDQGMMGGTLEEAVATVKAFDGAADIVRVGISGFSAQHPSSWNSEKGKPLTLRFAQAIKESGVKMLVMPNGGYMDPDLNEEFIATGKCDMVAMARAFIADPDYTEKLYEGRGEDVVPCIMCNKCHGISMTGQWYSVCSVNPKLGIDSALKVLKAPSSIKKIAVIGGGPGGMKAAITAAERGHKVTLYEKSDSLGGLLKHADFSPYKWALKDFKDYLIHQLDKAGVEVRLGATATPDMVKAKGYDAVMIAIGAEPVIPKIPGADSSNIWNIINVYGKEKSLGKNVALIGGGEYGTETGMYLAKTGHKVTILTSEKELYRIDRIHYPEIVQQTYEHLKDFDFITEATAKNISGGKVSYVDAKGNEEFIEADSVVIYGGLKPRQDEALKFFGLTKAFFTIGDCSGKGGNVQRVIRSAFFAASQI